MDEYFSRYSQKYFHDSMITTKEELKEYNDLLAQKEALQIEVDLLSQRIISEPTPPLSTHKSKRKSTSNGGETTPKILKW